MFFYEILGLKDINRDKENIVSREAVRAIILKGNKILLIKSNTGDYKFPGGGVEVGESYIDALNREVIEESGYIVNNINEKLGVIIERAVDKFKNNSIFEMTSYYYICDLSEEKTTQNLDEYEIELEFLPVWISIDKAICENELIIKEEKSNMNSWVYRETLALKKIKEYIESV